MEADVCSFTHPASSENPFNRSKFYTPSHARAQSRADFSSLQILGRGEAWHEQETSAAAGTQGRW